MEKSEKRTIISNELIFFLYFWRLIILKPITTTYLSYGMIILLIYSFVLVLISFLKNRKNFIRFEPVNIILLVFYVVFLFDFFFRPSMFITDYMYELFLYGVLPVYFLLQVTDFSRFIKIFYITSLLLFLVYCTDPINDFRYFHDYMVFGFQLAFPAFIGIDIGRTYYKKQWLIIFEILCLIELFIFANRSCALGVIFYFILKNLFISGFNHKTNKWLYFKWLIIAMGFLLIAIYWENIILAIAKILEDQGYLSYSLSQYVYYIEKGSFITGSATGGRSGIWRQALEMFYECPLIGSGSGAFIDKYGYYTHNIISDLLVQYGMAGFLFLTYYIIKAIKKSFNNTLSWEKRIVLLILFCLWCPKLFFSTTLFADVGLWCYLALSLSKRFYENDLPQVTTK